MLVVPFVGIHTEEDSVDLVSGIQAGIAGQGVDFCSETASLGRGVQVG